jgi:iron(II)-dependent oxidoreductase
VLFTPGGRPAFTFGGMEFVRVKGGDFYMGSDNIEFASPQHLVYQLGYDFYIGRYPVTNQEHSLYLRETGMPIVMAKDKAKHPAVNISFGDALAYITWLNKKYAKELPSGYRFRLPSEAEWEKAARGVEGNEYPWGNRFDPKRCNSREGGVGGTTPIGAYSPQGDSAFGAADMAGNVWEWTRSLWGSDESKPQFKYPYRFDDKREDESVDSSILRVLRGGSFDSSGSYARCAFRYRYSPCDFDDLNYGFRVVVSAA